MPAPAGKWMNLIRTMLAGLLMLGAAAPAAAADHCFSRNEQKAQTAAHTVVPLSRAVRQVRPRGELIRARLCERDGHLVYLVTLLAIDGKVAQASIDAESGTLLGPRTQGK